MDYKKMNFEDIYNWCKNNGQLKWLKAKVEETVEVDVYPYIIIDGKRTQDRTVAPTKETRPISFLLVKEAFVAKFMPDIKPTKKKAKTMLDWFK